MEMCCGFGGMGYYLAHKLGLKEAIFVDVDPGVEQSILLNNEISCYFQSSPTFEKGEHFYKYIKNYVVCGVEIQSQIIIRK